MDIKFNIIAAMCLNNGIGLNNSIPWNIKTDIKFFKNITSKTIDKNKKNIVIMGRKTWDSIPNNYKPLKNRINIILTKQYKNFDNNTISCHNFSCVLYYISQPHIYKQIENIWIIGGATLYNYAINSEYIDSIYLTIIHKNYNCDTFFPNIPNNFINIENKDIPKGLYKENDIIFEYKFYKKIR